MENGGRGVREGGLGGGGVEGPPGVHEDASADGDLEAGVLGIRGCGGRGEVALREGFIGSGACHYFYLH